MFPDDLVHPIPGQLSTSGLTKREYFAANMMRSLRSRNTLGGSEYLAKQAVEDADALIAELNKNA